MGGGDNRGHDPGREDRAAFLQHGLQQGRGISEDDGGEIPHRRHPLQSRHGCRGAGTEPHPPGEQQDSPDHRLQHGERRGRRLCGRHRHRQPDQDRRHPECAVRLPPGPYVQQRSRGDRLQPLFCPGQRHPVQLGESGHRPEDIRERCGQGHGDDEGLHGRGPCQSRLLLCRQAFPRRRAGFPRPACGQQRE